MEVVRFFHVHVVRTGRLRNQGGHSRYQTFATTFLSTHEAPDMSCSVPSTSPIICQWPGCGRRYQKEEHLERHRRTRECQ